MRASRTGDLSTLRDIADTDLSNDDHVRDLFQLALPDLVGLTMLAWVMADGGEPLPAVSVIEDSPSLVSVAEAHQMVRSLAHATSHFSDAPGLLIAWKRRGGSAPNDDDLAWLRAAPDACAEMGVQLLGVWLVAGSAAPLRLDAPLGAEH